MTKALIWRLCALALPVVLMAAAPAQASTVIDFEANGIPEIIGPWDYQQGDYIISSPSDFSTIGYANPDDPNAPTGNDSLYYSVLNKNVITIRRVDGGFFDLLSFDAALLPDYIGYSDDGAEPRQVYGGEVMFSNDRAYDERSTGIISAQLAGSSTGQYAFTHFDDLGEVTSPYGGLAFRHLTEVRIFGCMYQSATEGCDIWANSQIALDNIEVQASIAAVPEPSTWALFGLGLCGLALQRRRLSVRNRTLPVASIQKAAA